MFDMSVKSVRLEEIMDYINPKVAFIKVDAEGKDCMVRLIVDLVFYLFFSFLALFHYKPEIDSYICKKMYNSFEL